MILLPVLDYTAAATANAATANAAATAIAAAATANSAATTANAAATSTSTAAATANAPTKSTTVATAASQHMLRRQSMLQTATHTEYTVFCAHLGLMIQIRLMCLNKFASKDKQNTPNTSGLPLFLVGAIKNHFSQMR